MADKVRSHSMGPCRRISAGGPWIRGPISSSSETRDTLRVVVDMTTCLEKCLRSRAVGALRLSGLKVQASQNSKPAAGGSEPTSAETTSRYKLVSCLLCSKSLKLLGFRGDQSPSVCTFKLRPALQSSAVCHISKPMAASLQLWELLDSILCTRSCESLQSPEMKT